MARPLLLIGVLAAGLAGGILWMFIRAEAPTTLTPVTFQLGWTHSGSYAGYYVAAEQGYFANHGIAMTFLEGGRGVDPIKRVVEGQAQIGLADASEIITARMNGQSIKALGCLYNRSPFVIVTKKESGIDHPSKFGGLTIRATADNAVVIRAMARKFGVAADSMTFASRPGLDDFLNGKVDAWTGFVNSSVQRIRESGVELNVLHPDNYGIHFYYDCLLARDDFVEQNQGVLRGLVRAIYLEGWPQVIRDPEQAVHDTLLYDPDLDPDFERGKIAGHIPMLRAGDTALGSMDPATWKTMVDFLYPRDSDPSVNDASLFYATGLFPDKKAQDLEN